MSDVTQKFGVGGFLYNHTTRCVLLHHRDGNTIHNPNRWAFFTGLNEPDETPVNAFIRELREELGVELARKDVIPLCDYFNEVDAFGFIGNVYVFFVFALVHNIAEHIINKNLKFFF